jgi:hypothetical protein
MAPAAYTQQPHKFNRFNRNGLFGRDRSSYRVLDQKSVVRPPCFKWGCTFLVSRGAGGLSTFVGSDQPRATKNLVGMPSIRSIGQNL